MLIIKHKYHITLKLIIVLACILISTSCNVTQKTQHKDFRIFLNPYLYYYQGLQNRLYGNIDEAITLLNNSLNYDTTNAVVYYELSLCYQSKQDIENFLSSIKKAVELNPDNEHYRQLYSIGLISSMNIKEAYDNQKLLIKISPNNTNYKFQLAILASDLGHLDESLKLLNDIEEKFGTIPRVSETKLRIFLDKDQIEQAKTEVERLIQLAPNNPLNYIYKSEIYFNLGEDSIGFKSLNKAKEISPEYPVTNIELYQRYHQTGNFLKAINYLDTLVTDNQLNINEKISFFNTVLYEQSYYLYHGEVLDTIIENLLNENESNIYLHDLAYEHYIRRSDFKRSRQLLNRLVELDENNPERLERLISFDFSFQRKEQVIYNSFLGIKRFPQHHIFYVFNSLILDEVGNIEGSITTLQKGIENVKDAKHLSELYGTLGDIYYKIKKSSKAYHSYNQSLKHDPSNARVLNNYSYYLALDGKKLTKALEMSSKAVELEPNNSTYIDTQGWVLFCMGRYDEARELLRNAIAKGGSSSADINEHYGDVLYKTGNKDNAYIYWLKAKELGNKSESLELKIKTKSYVP